MKSFWSAVILVTIVSSCSAQPDTLWTRTYGGDSTDICRTVCQTGDGGFGVGGETWSFGSGGADFWLIRIDSNGDSLWSDTYGGQSDDIMSEVIAAPDSGFLMVGRTRSFGSGGQDVWVVRTDILGDTLWTRNLGGEADDQGWGVILHSSGRYYIAASTNSFGAGSSDYWLICMNDSGDTVWTHTYGDSRLNWTSSLVERPDSSIAICCVTDLPNGQQTVEVLRVSASGDSLGSSRYWDHSYETWGLGICVLPSGALVAAGYTWESVYDPDGDGLIIHGVGGSGPYWHHRVGGSLMDYCEAVHASLDQGIVVAGYSDSYGPGVEWWDFWLVKLDTAGNTVWNTTFDHDAVELCHDFVVLPEGFLMVGETQPEPGWLNIFPDAWVVLAGDAQSVPMRGTTIANEFHIGEFSPNPFNSSTRIAFDLPREERVVARVYNVTGQQVRVLADQRFAAGRHDLTFEGDDLPSGIYFCNVQAGALAQTQKMILLK